MDNYLKSALDAQQSYYQTVSGCLHTLLEDTFRAHPTLLGVQVELDYIQNPPYSVTYVLRTYMVDLGCGWVIPPTAYMEDLGRVLSYIYTHAPAIITTKGMGLVSWGRTSYNV
jgi:hypothetical protein